MKIKETTFYKFKHRKDVVYSDTNIKGIDLDKKDTDDWLEIKEGRITIFGTNKDGYAWDGCSPKFSLFDIILGTPDGIINTETNKPKTYYALWFTIFYINLENC